MNIQIQPKDDYDVVIVSETDMAVALSYRPNQDQTPRVIGKWSGPDGAHVIRLAKQIGLPFYEDNVLTRNLYENVRVEEEIPPQYFEPVATALAVFYRIDRPSRTYFYKDCDPQIVTTIELKIGYGLIDLVRAEFSGDEAFVHLCDVVRTSMASNLGVLLPPVRIRDDLNLAAQEYAFILRGRPNESGILYPDRVLAIRTKDIDHEIDGIPCLDPDRHSPSVWIKPEQRELAEKSGYYILDPVTVVLGHMYEFLVHHAAVLLSMDQTQKLLDKAKAEDEMMVTWAMERFGLDRIHALFQDLLSERLPIFDVLTILDALVRSDGTESLAVAHRALAPSICSGLMGKNDMLHVVPLSDEMEESLCRRIRKETAGSFIDFGTDREKEEFEKELARLGEKHYAEIVFEVRSPELRRPFFDLVNAYVPKYFRKFWVLGRDEIPHNVMVQAHDGALRHSSAPSQPYPQSAPERLLLENDADRVKAVVAEWTDLFTNAAVDKVALFDAIADFYDIHGKRPPTDIFYCSHPATPIIAAVVARDFHNSHMREGACGRDHPASDQLKMADFNLLNKMGFGGVPVRFLYWKFGRKAVVQYLTTLSESVCRELNGDGDICRLRELYDSIFLDPLAGEFERLSARVHDNDLFRDSVNQAIELALSPMRFRPDPRDADDVRGLKTALIFYGYWDMKRMMGNHIMFDIVAERHAQSGELQPPPDMAAEIQKIRKETDCLKKFYSNGGWTFLAFENTAFIVLRPQRIELDLQTNRLHSATGPAAVLSDGLEIYRHRGMVVPPVVINDPQSLSFETIMKEENAEVRRLMIARKGLAAFIKEAAPQVLDEDTDRSGNPRRLYKIEMPSDESVVVLHVIDPAKKRMGLAPDVFLRVPPARVEAEHAANGTLDEREKEFWEGANGEMKTCAQAVAWTFRFQPEEYAPLVET